MTTDDDAPTCEGCQIRGQDRDRLRVLANRLMDDNDRNHRIIDRVCAVRDDALRKLAELEESVVTKEAATTATDAVAWAAAELTSDPLHISAVTGPSLPAAVTIHPSAARDVEDWLQTHGYRWSWTGFDGNILLLCRPGHPVTMARIGDRLRWTGNRVRVEGR